MKGKQRCRILKQIRKEIADANGIDYVISECPHKGDCAGTCPKCESEVAYLERELEKRRQTGKKVAIAGIAAAAVISSAACRKEGFRPGENGTGVSDGSLIPATSETGTSTGEILQGGMILPLQGDIAYPSCGRVEGIFSGSPHAEGAQVPDIGELMYSHPEIVREMLSGFRFDEVTEAWKQYVCDCFVENGAGFLYDGFEVHVYRNADGYVDIFEVITG